MLYKGSVDDPKYDLPPERRTAYYMGMVILGIGILLFLSVFFGEAFAPRPSTSEFFRNPMGTMDDMQARNQSSTGRGVLGFVLIGIGAVLAGVGRSGLAGSGLKLDPRQAREDLEPWNRAAGGMLNDTLEEVQVLRPSSAETEVKVRCPKCRALNDESDKFCGQCGGSL